MLIPVFGSVGRNHSVLYALTTLALYFRLEREGTDAPGQIDITVQNG